MSRFHEGEYRVVELVEDELDKIDRKRCEASGEYLKKKIRRNIEMRYALFVERWNFSETAKVYGLSRSRIAQLFWKTVHRAQFAYVRREQQRDKGGQTVIRGVKVVRTRERILFDPGGPYEGLRDIDAEERAARNEREMADKKAYAFACARSKTPVDSSTLADDLY